MTFGEMCMFSWKRALLIIVFSVLLAPGCGKPKQTLPPGDSRLKRQDIEVDAGKRGKVKIKQPPPPPSMEGFKKKE